MNAVRCGVARKVELGSILPRRFYLATVSTIAVILVETNVRL